MLFLCCYDKIAPVAMQKTIFDYFPLISSLVVILLFILDRIIAAKIRQREIARNWYLKILIEPNLDLINAFYTSAYANLEAAVNELIASRNLGHTQFLALVTAKTGLFLADKRRFEFDFIYLVGSYNSTVALELNASLRLLEDIVNETLGATDHTSLDMTTIKNRIHTARAGFYSAIYKPITNNSKRV